MEDNNAKRYYSHLLRIFFLFVIILLVLVAGLVIIVDPFFHFHQPLSGFPYLVDDQINQNPGMARELHYDSFITGSSMTVNFDTKDFAPAFGRTVKLSYDGAYPKNLSLIMDCVYDPDSPSRKANPVRSAIIGVDILVFTADPDETKFPLTDYLYDDNPFNDICYVLNKSVILDYIAAPLLRNHPTDLSTVYEMSWITKDLTGKDYVLSEYTPADRKSTEADPQSLIERTRVNLEKNIIPYIRAHPETEFVFFFPPYSILFWNNVEREKMLEARLAQTEYIGETLLSFDNVRIFYFSDMEDIITDFDNYTDYTHYIPAVSKRLAQDMSAGVEDGEEHAAPGNEKAKDTELNDTHEVKRAGMKEKTDHMRKIVRSYDFKSLLGDDGA